MTLNHGIFSATVATIASKLSIGSVLRLSSTWATSKPREAVKSSSLPIMTSTWLASRVLTSRACSWPPMPAHRLGR